MKKPKQHLVTITITDRDIKCLNVVLNTADVANYEWGRECPESERQVEKEKRAINLANEVILRIIQAVKRSKHTS
jgi:tRNA(Leu) C34 or U34 (ribose-2'-O)-methylase TrmL